MRTAKSLPCPNRWLIPEEIFLLDARLLFSCAFVSSRLNISVLAGGALAVSSSLAAILP